MKPIDLNSCRFYKIKLPFPIVSNYERVPYFSTPSTTIFFRLLVLESFVC